MPGASVVLTGDVAVDAAGSDLAFTLEADLTRGDALGEIPIYDWGEEACCLPAGATECVLVRPTPGGPLGDALARAGDLLAFEVVDPDDAARHASWARRQQDWPTDAAGPALPRAAAEPPAQVVELTAVEPFADPLLGGALAADPRALARGGRARALAPGRHRHGAGGDEVTVARGEPGAGAPRPAGRRAAGDDAWLAAPDPETGPVPPTPDRGPAARPPAAALSLAPDGSAPAAWTSRSTLPSGLDVAARATCATLLDAGRGPSSRSSSTSRSTSRRSCASARARSGSRRRSAVWWPPPTRSAAARSATSPRTRSGSSSATPSAPGLVPAVAARAGRAASATRWPRPAAPDPMPLDDVRRDAPEAFAAELRRAVLPADHAAAAADDPARQRAMAQRAWSGSWPLVTTVVDLAAERPTPRPRRRRSCRRRSTACACSAPRPPSLRHAGRALPRARGLRRPRLRPGGAARRILGAAPGHDEQPGLFHPARLQLGARVYLSAVVAAVAALPGVDAVEVRRGAPADRAGRDGATT